VTTTPSELGMLRSLREPGTGLRTPWARQMQNGLRRTPREGRGEHLFGINDNSRRSALTRRTTLPHADEPFTTQSSRDIFEC
jgi:hypothetical protein